MVDVGSWYGRSRREAAICSMRVAGVGRSRREAARWSMRVAGVAQSRREAARCSMRVAGVVEVGRSMSRFLKYTELTRGGAMWLLVCAASRTLTRSCNAGACGRCGRQSVQRVVRGLGAAMHLSWSKLVLAAWSCRVKRVWWQRLNRVLAQWTKWTDRVSVAKVCHAFAYVKSSERIGKLG